MPGFVDGLPEENRTDQVDQGAAETAGPEAAADDDDLDYAGE